MGALKCISLSLSLSDQCHATKECFWCQILTSIYLAIVLFMNRQLLLKKSLVYIHGEKSYLP